MTWPCKERLEGIGIYFFESAFGGADYIKSRSDSMKSSRVIKRILKKTKEKCPRRESLGKNSGFSSQIMLAIVIKWY